MYLKKVFVSLLTISFLITTTPLQAQIVDLDGDGWDNTLAIRNFRYSYCQDIRNESRFVPSIQLLSVSKKLKHE